MVEREPVSAKNLDIYGSAMIAWRQLRDAFAGEPLGPEHPFFLGTCGPGGEPHAAGIGPAWYDGDFYFTSGPRTRKSKHLAGDPRCTLSGRIAGFDVVMEGRARRVTDHGTVETLAAIYRAGGWPAEASGDALTAPYSAQSAGRPPWHLYRFTYDTVVALQLVPPHGAAKWIFG